MSSIHLTISQDDRRFKALWLKVRPDHAEVLSFTESEGDNHAWAAHCRRVMEQNPVGHPADSIHPIVSFDLISPAYYEMALPPVKPEQLEQTVAMQVETLLPFAAGQMRHDRKLFQTGRGSHLVLAAVHGDVGARIGNLIPPVQPGRIWLIAEAIVAARRSLFEKTDSHRTVIYVGRKTTWISFMRQGRMAGGACCDVGSADLWPDGRFNPVAAEQLAQDIFHTVTQNSAYAKELVELIAGPEPGFQTLCDYLESLALNSRLIRPVSGCVEFKTELAEPVESFLYRFLIPLGLGFATVEPGASHFELCRELHYQPPVRQIRLGSPPLGLSIVAAVLMALLLLLAAYGKTVADNRRTGQSIESLEKQFKDRYPEMTLDQWRTLQDTRKLLGPLRPDLLEFWALLHDKTPKTIQYDSIECVMGQPVTISAQARGLNKKAIYDFQDALIALPGFERVILSPITSVPKEERMTFSVTFEYGPFKATRKRTGLSTIPQL